MCLNSSARWFSGYVINPRFSRTRCLSNSVPTFGQLFANPHRDSRQSTARPTTDARSHVREAARSRSKTAIQSENYVTKGSKEAGQSRKKGGQRLHQADVGLNSYQSSSDSSVSVTFQPEFREYLTNLWADPACFTKPPDTTANFLC